MFISIHEDLKTVTRESLDFLSLSESQIPEILIDVPNDKTNGDLTTNVALKISKALKRSPYDIAGQIKDNIERRLPKSCLHDKIARCEAKKPGFINFFLTPEAFYEILYDVLKAGDSYGRQLAKKEPKIQIEFVSANPTGPLSVAHARQAAVGDCLANILKFLGYDVCREYYINDEGNQINLLGQSILCRAKEILGETAELPENGYQGEYIKDMAALFLKERGIGTLKELKSCPQKLFSEFGVNFLIGVIKKELSDFGVTFDAYSSQAAVATPQAVADVLEHLREKGYAYESDGALWFKSTALGDDKDRVVRKSDGSFTYLAPDIVYHRDKYRRGFQKLFNIWGPDHHGYIPRLKAAVQALGYSGDSLEVLIVQLATIYRDGKPLSMSTRRGQYISLREVIDEVGVDAARYFFLMRHINAHLDFDLELAKKQTPENPIFYIQYAHARICSIMEFAKDKKDFASFKVFTRLKEEEEIELIRKIGQFASMLFICEKQRDPYALTAYLLELANCFHKFYDKHRVISEDEILSHERFFLVKVTKIVLANGLKLLGVSAPTKM